MVPSPWWANSTSVWIKTACNRIGHRHHNISLLLTFVNPIQENPLEVMRHFLHNTTLTWRLFSPTWVSVITTAHRSLKISCVVQPVGAATDALHPLRESEELLKNNQHKPHPRLLTGQDSMTGARSFCFLASIEPVSLSGRCWMHLNNSREGATPGPSTWRATKQQHKHTAAARSHVAAALSSRRRK